MVDTQKTTKGVREAPTASRRYSVVHTSGGWKIEDHNAGFERGGLLNRALLIHVFSSREAAEEEARYMNRGPHNG